MKNIFKHLTTKKLRDALVSTFERVPLSVIFSLITFVLFAVQIGIDDMSTSIESLIGKSIITLIVMFLLSIAVYLYNEVSNAGKVTAWRNQLVTIIFGLLFYAFFEENLFSNFYAESFVYIAMTVVGTVAAVFIAPFILHIVQRQAQQREFYVFGYNIVMHTAMAVVVGTAVMLLGFAGWAAITALFDIHFSDIYAYWGAFSLSLLAPVFFLSQLPSVKVDTSIKIEDDRFFGFLIKYIGLPAIIFYFVILYAYTIKVLINFTTWPHGEIAWMVIGFSVFGYLVYTASYIFEKDFKPAQVFRKFFPYIVIPQVAMLFYAIGLRINQYDITINRYFVVAFGVWLFLVSCHFIFSKKKYLGVLPLSLLLCITVISIGPWSVYTLPEARQLTHLQANLVKAGILQDGSIAPLADTKSIDAKLSGEIYEGIEYICNSHGCDTLRPLFTDAMIEIQAKDIERFEQEKKDSISREKDMIKQEKDTEIKAIYEQDLQNIEESTYTPMRNWSMIQSLTEYLGVHPYDRYGRDVQGVQQYKNFTSSENRDGALRISGYDYMVRINDFNSPKIPDAVLLNIKEDVGKKEEATLQYSARINMNTEELKIMRGDELVETLSVHDAFAGIISGDTERLTFTIRGSEVQVKVALSDLTLPNPEWTPGEGDVRKEGIAPWRYGGATAYGTALIKEL